MQIVTIKNSDTTEFVFTPEDIFDKEILKNDLMKLYSKDELEADIWILYNYKLLKELVAKDLLTHDYDNEFNAYESYQVCLEFLMVGSLLLVN